MSTWWMLGLLSLTAPPSPATQPAVVPGKILMVPVMGHTVPAAAVRSVDTQLQAACEALMPGRQVKRKQRPTACTNARCFADLGAATGAQEVVIGEVLRIGGKLGVTLHLVHVSNAELAKHTAEAVVPPNETALRQALQAALRDLLTLQAAPAPPAAEPLQVAPTATPAHTDIMQVAFSTPVPGDAYDVGVQFSNSEMHCERDVVLGAPCVLRFDPSYAHLQVLRRRDDALFSRLNRALGPAGTEERYPFVSRKLPRIKGNYHYGLRQNDTAVNWMTAGGVLSIAAGATALATGAADIALCQRSEPGSQLACQIGVPTAISTAVLTVVGVATFFIAREFLEGSTFAEDEEPVPATP